MRLGGTWRALRAFVPKYFMGLISWSPLVVWKRRCTETFDSQTNRSRPEKV